MWGSYFSQNDSGVQNSFPRLDHRYFIQGDEESRVKKCYFGGWDYLLGGSSTQYGVKEGWCLGGYYLKIVKIIINKYKLSFTCTFEMENVFNPIATYESGYGCVWKRYNRF